MNVSSVCQKFVVNHLGIHSWLMTTHMVLPPWQVGDLHDIFDIIVIDWTIYTSTVALVLVAVFHMSRLGCNYRYFLSRQFARN